MLWRLYGDRFLKSPSSCERKNRVVTQSHRAELKRIPKTSVSDIEEFCIDIWPDWGACRFRRVQTTHDSGEIQVVTNVPTPDESSEILWRIVQAHKSYRHENRCQLYNHALVNGAVEGLAVSLPRLPSSSSCRYSSGAGLEETLSLDNVPRTMLSMAYLGCHLAWEEEMDSLCRTLPHVAFQSLRQVDDCLRALRLSRHKCSHVPCLDHIDRCAGSLLEQSTLTQTGPDRILHTAMLGGNIAYHIVYQRKVPRDTLRGVLQCLSGDIDGQGSQDVPSTHTCISIVGASVAFTDCVRGEHVDPDLDSIIYQITDILIKQIVRFLSASGETKDMPALLHRLYPFLSWMALKAPTSVALSTRDERRILNELFKKSVRIRESMRDKHTVSAVQKDVYNVLRNMGMMPELEQHIQGISVDMTLPRHLIAIEVDGSSHFFRNEPTLRIGYSAFKEAMLNRMGWTLAVIPQAEWDSVPRDAQSEYIASMLSI